MAYTMVRTIRPTGAVNIRCVRGVGRDRDGRFALVDDCANIYGISETDFHNLLGLGIKEMNLYENKRYKNQ